MIPIEPLSLESKLFYLSAVEFGGRLFRGPDAPEGQALDDWLELVSLGPAELVNMLPDDRPARPGGEPDYALPALLARLTQVDGTDAAPGLAGALARLLHPATAGTENAAMAHQLALDLERLMALLARGFLGEAPDMAAQAGTLCRDVLAPRIAALGTLWAGQDPTGVFAAAATVMLAVVRDLGQRL
jgi:hypothetical protein